MNSKESPEIKDAENNDVKPIDSNTSASKVVVNEKEKKKQAFVTRSIWTFVMLLFFLAIISSGHLTLIAFVVLFQVLTFKEIIRLVAEPARDKNIPLNKFVNWYFLFSTIYYLDGKTLFEFFHDLIFQNKLMIILSTNHKIISYFLYVFGFMIFILNLKKGYYKFQFGSLCITHMTLLIVVFQSHLIINNILNGIIWFVLPCTLVIVNDIFAYLCGITFGRTQLIAISPKKTVEGFVGAWFCTVVASVGASFILSRSNYLICPATNLNTNVYNFPSCEPNSVFIEQIVHLPGNLKQFFNIDYIIVKPIYYHSVFLATFASLFAPFGGFFASGLKRAFGIKDFGDTIPGHGGITDRIDCQFLMGSFSYLYYQTFISSYNINLTNIIQAAIINLSIDELFQVIKSLLKFLYNSGILAENDFNIILSILDKY
ncbi:phosphatidate cytidylyltransferase [Yamadazyma tenuis]|uniref:Phosphatidate cytidylyltransferase n=1 Tax=Candida tenuis (strain ATCC 10573 / BCRC 21748 / CBS 615 / JCM 9827 / NBRC 10315 / NRRL Y-1498 / VKM Y-70) TaxID=590646 RepID=G3AYY6_CANTC|nr:phosphatidate cytidylyltransferase [Yamadazyma tenuis ATCC 10573]XP_006684832.1 uncharacterized protein CANTEDRAFT_112837 [Yamadazyma tenuis ATCC 10573]EGV66257.1 phosphatidate cytidylyltransferase [Yamadazyma tenuis ATCC 10573]EGV66258.1 hypothetical protein CANTEDRAFT_112837 [Yamadazyma tenuis ATCC 10573]WEJ95704.1 phosphatidate cytidylyltransferase [Yamadazyma tenuis]